MGQQWARMASHWLRNGLLWKPAPGSVASGSMAALILASHTGERLGRGLVSTG